MPLLPCVPMTIIDTRRERTTLEIVPAAEPLTVFDPAFVAGRAITAQADSLTWQASCCETSYR